MILRTATANDAPAILALWNPAIRTSLITFNSATKSLTDIDNMLIDKATHDYAFLLAEDADQLLGFATYGQFRAGVGYAHTMEHTIILAPQAHRRGIGRALMTAIEDHARSRGAHSIFAGVSAPNAQGRAFHAALGYREVAILPRVGRKFDQWLDLVLMQKFLT